MSKVNFLKTAEELVNFGRKNGANDVQVSIGTSSNFTVEVLKGEIERLTEASSTGLSLKVIVDNKVATASSNDFNEETLHKLVENAIERARLSGSDEFASLPEKRDITADINALKLFDPKIEELSPDYKISIAKDIERLAMLDKRINLSAGSYYYTRLGEYILANSNGFSGSYKSSSVSCGVELQAGSGDNLFEDGWHENSRSLNGLIPADTIAQKAINRIVRLIGAKKIDTCKIPVVLEPQMTAQFLGFLAECLYGRGIYMKQSFLAGKIGEKIGSDLVTVIDDSLMPGGLGSRPFDSEGVPGQINTIIENGKLNGYLLDTYSAKKLKMKSTGNASGTGNFYLRAGNHSPEDIIKSVKKGFMLVSTIGQGTVAVTGDISTGAYGLWIENGELGYPIAEVTINGNLGSLLKGIKMVGNDLQFRRSVSGPTVLIEEMTIAGK